MGSNPAQGNYSFPQKLSSVEFPITFSQFLLNLDCESICDPPGGDTLLAQGIYLTDYIYIYIYGRKRQINYNFIPTSLFRGRPLIRGAHHHHHHHRPSSSSPTPDEWATTKQACRDEIVVYLSFSSIYTTLYFYVLSTVLRKSSFTLYICIYIYI